MKQIKILLTGAAFAADLHADAYSRMRDKAKIVAIADKAADRIEKLANTYGFTDFKAFDDYKSNYGNGLRRCRYMPSEFPSP